jgi:predicted lipoprotein with Yx(FWY)xxD motif
MTLYALSAEHGGKWICTSTGCLKVWHPVTASGGSAPTGTASLSVIKRPDGTEQVTYKGMPLYTFAEDSAPGQAKGEGVKDVGTWNAVKTASASQSSSSSSAASSGSSSGGSSSGGGGYAY